MYYLNYDTNDLMKPWTIKTVVTDRVQLIFIPFYERIAHTNLFIFKSDMYQVIGYFSVSIKTDLGDKILIDNMSGSVEDYFGQW